MISLKIHLASNFQKCVARIFINFESSKRFAKKSTQIRQTCYSNSSRNSVRKKNVADSNNKIPDSSKWHRPEMGDPNFLQFSGPQVSYRLRLSVIVCVTGSVSVRLGLMTFPVGEEPLCLPVSLVWTASTRSVPVFFFLQSINCRSLTLYRFSSVILPFCFLLRFSSE